MSGRARAGAALLALAAVASGARAQAGAPNAGVPAAPVPNAGVAVRVGVSRAPDTVRVGDPFRVLLRVAAPAGTRVAFPAQADSAAPVEVIGGPRQRSNATPDGSVDVTAE